MRILYTLPRFLHSTALLGFCMTTLLAGCVAPEPGPRYTATVVGPAATTTIGPDTAAPSLQRQAQMQPAPGVPAPSTSAATAQESARSAGPLASNEHPEMTCAMHRKMMIAMTPEEREAVIAAHLRDMSPEVRARYLKRLRGCAAQ